MQINRLRLLGFKSFVEPTDLLIETGLTGVVGPNGCGKSNLLEALRWVMGETSHKSMRAAAMDDVIFAGTTQRPARNVAEVTLFLDNSARTAPAEFNGADVIEITRRIEREAGSAYRVNGADVRARDVKILFEDAATGARSPALVRQGQIAEIVNAKPEQRRRILEDAAGVAGLHSRRHDAELRLKAAEANLARLADIMGSYSSQIESLKRQARQARRYRELSTEIRKAEAIAAHVAWTEATALLATEEATLGEVLVRLGAAVAAESQSLRAEASLAESLQPLRDDEAIRAAVLARLQIERANFDREAERAAERQRELTARVAQLDADVTRESALAAEAAETLERLDAELMELAEADEGAAEAEEAATSALDAARRAEAEASARLATFARRDFELKAHARSLAAGLAERRDQASRITRQLAGLETQIRELAAMAPDAARLADVIGTTEELVAAIADAEASASEADEAVRLAALDASRCRDAAAKAGLELRGVETERATLGRLLRPRSGDGFTPVLDQLTVAAGYEVALGAALGDDLDAPAGVDDDARSDGGEIYVSDLGQSDLGQRPLLHWRRIDAHPDDPSLPPGVEPLAARIDGPAALTRGLAQVGVVANPADGARLQPTLKAGQRLVSIAGDVWRWDGFVATADAPTASADRLAQKNRLTEIERRLVDVEAAAAAATAADLAARQALARGEDDGRRARAATKDAQSRLARLREEQAALERRARDSESRLAAAREARDHARDTLAEALERVADIEATIEVAEETEDLDSEIAAAEAVLADARARIMQAASAAAGLQREDQLRAERLAKSRADRHRWASRAEAAGRQVATLRARAEEARRELDAMADLPAEIEAQRQRLLDELTNAEWERTAAADRLVAADSRLRDARQVLRAAQAALVAEREARARFEARVEASRQRHAEETRRIRETLHCEPEQCLALAAFPADAALPGRDEIERQLDRMRTDRERLGGVNLAAEDELEAINAQVSTLEQECRDVEAAVAKLRGAIGQLNREGKKRVDEAFEAVNAHFQELFTTLFDGGEARLEMLEGEDPLAGGLEIIAKPPGKKPATLSLLSGGEQTLTALSLIFAVFLTNPSPICVLDEVDAPLDDANVDRFSTMMEKMAAETETRFLVITHHPQTMARMNRLFGVTMAEKGVSQLVSVDLATAERIVEDASGGPRRDAAE